MLGVEYLDFGRRIDKGCRDSAPRTTMYSLIATGRDGRAVTRTLLIAVRLR
jgi:hypothetical protein